MQSKVLIVGLTLLELKAHCEKWGIKPFVAKQVFDWIFKKKVTSFSKMKNIAKQTQVILEEHAAISVFSHIETLSSDEENAIKVIATLLDGKRLESVILTQDDYYTLCVSSQCGCPVDCKFCLTGVAGFKRNLSAAEIVGQILQAEEMGYPISNIVFMGMGEPLLNYEAVFKAIDILTAEYGFHISKRHITVSTSGYIQGIKRLIQEEKVINLAFSVGSADPIKRIRLMPIEQRNPILEVASLLHTYLSQHNRKLTLEYTLLEGVNDTAHDILALVHLARYLNAKVNLINLNPHPKIPYKPVSHGTLMSIQTQLKSEKIPVTIRYKKGQDITAACGQLGESLL